MTLRRTLHILLALLLLTMLAGCQKQPARPDGVRPPPSPERILQDTAEQAYQGGQWSKSELYHGQLLELGQGTPAERSTWSERYVVSALRAGHARNALSGLKAWAEMDPTAPSRPAWQAARIEALHASGDETAALLALDAFLDDSMLPAATRLELGERVFEGFAAAPAAPGLDDRIMTLLSRLAPLARDRDDRLRLEDSAREFFMRLPDDRLAAMAAGSSPSGPFPEPLASFLHAARLAERIPEAWPAAWQTMRRALTPHAFARPDPLARILARLEDEHGVPSVSLALLLPLSGRFENVGWSILRGADAAGWQFASQGAPVSVHVINTESPDWLAEFAALPPGPVVVGGPLEIGRFRELAASNALAGRVLFGFLPSLGEAAEGREAWRFFGSLDDQISALVRFSMNDLGITRFAVVAPQENFGLRAAALFQEQVARNGGHVTANTTYHPAEPARWGRTVAEMLKAPDRDPALSDRMPPPDPSFQAVFMPDGWAQAQLLAPHFHFYEQEQFVLLGPELWSQALAASREVDTRYFRLAASPGPWSSADTSAGRRSLRQALADMGLGEPDFWTALGFDFVRFGVRLGGFERGFGPPTVNRRLASLDDFEWSLAPITWNENGQAHQELFIFTPASNGLAILDTDAFRARLEQTRERQKERVEFLREKLAEERRKIRESR